MSKNHEYQGNGALFTLLIGKMIPFYIVVKAATKCIALHSLWMGSISTVSEHVIDCYSDLYWQFKSIEDMIYKVSRQWKFFPHLLGEKELFRLYVLVYPHK